MSSPPPGPRQPYTGGFGPAGYGHPGPAGPPGVRRRPSRAPLIVGLVLAFLFLCCCGGYGTLWWYEDSYVPQQREDLLRYFGAPEGFGLDSKSVGDDAIAASYVLRCQPASACPPDPLGKLADWATRVGAPGVTSTSLANIFQNGGSDRRTGLRWDDFEIDLTLSGSVASDGSQAVFGATIVIKGGCWSCG